MDRSASNLKPADLAARKGGGASVRMIAIDLDGTLLGPDGKVSEANRKAVLAAREAGILVVVCTGRGLVESRPHLDAIAQTDPVVVAGGAMIACPVTSRTLRRFGMDRSLVSSVVDALHGHALAALVLKDPLAAGFDYLVVTGEADHPLDPVTEWWFRTQGVTVQRVRTLEDDPQPEHTVRVGACAMSSVLDRVEVALRPVLDERTTLHNFPAVAAPEHVRRLPDGESLHIFEVFDQSADKWNAMLHLGSQHGIDATQMAAIGDQINDLTMIRGAGLGIAMGNAIQLVKDAARQRTRGHHEDGVAHAIGQILSGAW
jgi:hydroxymethylpyrimidine pyrophosphatase-like HAD family hydrolase